uniref:Odorant receptor n=1 Tax=Cyrtorhinus lividipennis TaxID=1032904 RepID=A0A346TI14_9HEMI|nr:odorant receptor 6 [Cyrtorhinus lividipennis]
MKGDGAKVTKPLNDVLKFGGIWFDFDHLKYGTLLKWLNFLRHATAFVVWAIETSNLWFAGSSFILTESAIFIPIGFEELGFFVVIVSNMSTVNRVVGKYEEKIDRYSDTPWGKKIIDEEVRVFYKVFKLGKNSLVGFFIMYIVVPVSFDAIRAIAGLPPYLVPLPLNFLLGKQPERNYTYYTAIFVSYLFFAIIVPRFVATQSLILFFVLFIVIDVRICIKKIQIMSGNDHKGVGLQKEWDLKDIIDHHSQILDMVKREYNFIGFMLIAQNGFIALVLCLLSYMMKTSLNAGDLILAVFCGTFEFQVMIISLLHNGAGYIVEKQSEDLANELYNTAWYKQPPRIRKYVNTMIGQGVKMFNISYHMSPANLEAYLQVLNKSYSFFALINSKV